MNTFKIYNGIVKSSKNGKSGMDIYIPVENNARNMIIHANTRSNKIELQIRGTLYDPYGKNIGFMIIPKTDTGKNTPLRMSNSIEIIDATYRKPLSIYVDNISNENFSIENGAKLFKIVAFNGLPIRAEIVY